VNYERNKKGARFFETQCRMSECTSTTMATATAAQLSYTGINTRYKIMELTHTFNAS